jgi:DNA-binding winged helix-turn-helix (wHTH) protein
MTIVALGPFRLDPRNDLLLRGSDPVALGKRAIVLLRTLVEQRGELVSKDALIEAAWPGRIVEGNNLTVQIAALRRVLSTAPEGAGWIETLPRRGYRFIGPVIAEALDEVIERPSQVDTAPKLAPRPPPDPERRQVAAMSCELINARPTDGTDLEDRREAIRLFRRCIVETVARNGRISHSQLGNTTLVVFGFPVAHEDHAERASGRGLNCVRLLEP